MKDFFKREWGLFLQDMQTLGEFCLQPIEITGIPGSKATPMLKPTIEEIEGKAEAEFEAQSMGFWANEWNLFKKDLQNAKEFLTQPVTFK